MKALFQCVLFTVLVVTAGMAYGQPPKVVSVFPEDGTVDVPMVTEIRVQFDQPMDPNLAYLSCTDKKKETFYLECKDVIYQDGDKTFTFLMTLLPNTEYQIHTENSFGSIWDGYKSKDGVAAEPFSWSFKTKDIAPAGAPAPKLVDVTPDSGSVVSRMEIIKVEFDQPMMTQSVRMKVEGDGPGPEEAGMIPIIPAGNKALEIGVYFKAGWSGQITFYDMQSQRGVPAEPVTLEYKVGEKDWPAEVEEGVAKSEQDSRLKSVLEKIKTAVSEVKSFSETVQTMSESGSHGRFNQVSIEPSYFKVQGTNQFRADVTEVMGVPFIVGSDGEQCWHFYNDGKKPPQLTTVPFGEIAEKNISLCDPFGIKARSVEEIIEKENIVYLGSVQGSYTFITYDRVSANWLRLGLWKVDEETFLPTQLDMYWSVGSHSRYRYTFESINKEIPKSDFAPPESPEKVRKEAEPLNDDYTRRYLNCIDGSNGRMSVRWGRKGPKGTISGGLN